MRAFKALTKRFEVTQRSVKIKIHVNFFFSSGIGMERVQIKRSISIKWVKVNLNNKRNKPWQIHYLTGTAEHSINKDTAIKT